MTEHVDALVVDASIVRLIEADPIGLQQAEIVQVVCQRVLATICNAMPQVYR